MKFPDGKPKTLHTTNKVPFIIANARLKAGVSHRQPKASSAT